MIAWEIKKIFKSKNGIIALVLFSILSISMAFIKPNLEIEKNFEQTKSQWSKGSGKSDLAVEEDFNIKINQLKEFSKFSGKDEFSKEIKEISNKKLNAIKVNEYKNVEFWRTFNHRVSHPFMCFIILIIIILIFSNIYTDEVISNVDSLILSSRNKNKVLYSKLMLSIIVPMILYGGYLITQFIVAYIQCGKPINGGLQVIRILDNSMLIKDAYTIQGFLMLKISVMFMIFVTLGVLASLFSFTTKSSIQSMSGLLIFVFLGKVIALMKFLPNEILIIFSKANYIDLTLNFNNFIGMYCGRLKVSSMNLDLHNVCLGIMITILFIGIILCVNTFKKFLTR